MKIQIRITGRSTCQCDIREAIFALYQHLDKWEPKEEIIISAGGILRTAISITEHEDLDNTPSN